MTSTADFRVEPAEVTDATRQLDALVARVDKLMVTESPNLLANAPGRDEVSQRVAATLNDVQASFSNTADRGGTGLREIAMTLQAHADNIVAADQDFAV
jgi:hypothetical protein